MAKQDQTQTGDVGGKLPVKATAESEQARKHGAGERFARIYEDYIRQITEGWATAQKGLQRTSSKYNESQQSLGMVYSQKQADSWRKHAEESQQRVRDGASEESQHAVVEAYLRYQNELLLHHAETARKWEALRQEHQESVRTVQKDYMELCNQAYQRFLDALKGAWQATDNGSLDAWTLANIGQFLVQAAAAHQHATHQLGGR